jgi:hypothetical protein
MAPRSLTRRLFRDEFRTPSTSAECCFPDEEFGLQLAPLASQQAYPITGLRPQYARAKPVRRHNGRAPERIRRVIFREAVASSSARSNAVQLIRSDCSKGKFGVLYATGDDARNSGLTWADGEASIAKPYRAEDMVRALVLVREITTTGTATLPFPAGFRLLPETATGIVPACPA